MEKKTIVANFIAGPGTGKSTTMAAVFAKLKWRGIDCEIAPEYAKEVVWSNNFETLGDQLYIFAKQNHRLYRLKGKVDVILTDSPIIFSLTYGEHMTEAFKTLVKEQFGLYDNMNFFLRRVKPYNPNGRMQTIDEAKVLDQKMLDTLADHSSQIHTFDATEDNMDLIADLIEEEYNMKKTL